MHAYQRSTPVYNQTPTAGAPTYVVVGTGGNREGHAGGYVHPTPAWSAYRNHTSYGHGTVSVYNATHLRWQVAKFILKNQSILLVRVCISSTEWNCRPPPPSSRSGT